MFSLPRTIAVLERTPRVLDALLRGLDDFWVLRNYGEIMGIRHRVLPVEGVQFHPESILTLEGKRLLGNFLGVAAARP